MDYELKDADDGSEGGRGRSRLVWTPELHERFMNAVNHLVRAPSHWSGCDALLGLSLALLQCCWCDWRLWERYVSRSTAGHTRTSDNALLCCSPVQGVKHAVPKTILQLMNVEGLTRENVASHLQVCRGRSCYYISNGGPRAALLVPRC